MKQATHELSITTPGRGLVNINDEIVSWVHAQGLTTGLLTVFIRHTSASLVVQENADPDVLPRARILLAPDRRDGDQQSRLANRAPR